MHSLSVLLTAVLVTASLPYAFAQDSSASGDEVLQLLIEKAKERERLFDNVEVKLRREVPRSDGESPEIFHDSWAKSGSNCKITYKRRGLDGKITSSILAKTETDSRMIVTDSDSEAGKIRHASIRKADNLPLSGLVSSPEHFGVTALPIHIPGSGPYIGTGPLASFLNPETKPIGHNMANRTRDLYFAGEETIDGRTFLVVEERTTYEPSSFEGIVRVYFDPKLNYACAMVEITKKWSQIDSEKTELITMGDFQEIKPGLFVPYTMSRESAYQYTQDGERIRGKSKRTQVIEKLEWRDDFEEGFFDIEFPNGASVSDSRLGSRFYYTVGETPRIDIDIDEMLSDLEEIEADIEDAPAEETASPVADTEEPEPAVVQVAEDEAGPSGDGFLSGLLGAGIVIILFAVAAFLFLKRRKRS